MTIKIVKEKQYQISTKLNDGYVYIVITKTKQGIHDTARWYYCLHPQDLLPFTYALLVQ